MNKNKRSLVIAIGALLIFINTTVEAQKINASYSATAYQGPFTGKVLLYLSKYGEIPKDLSYGIPFFCCFSISVRDIIPGKTVLFDDAAVSFPVNLSDIERGQYYAQVVWDRNTGGRSIGENPDNMYNEPIKINLTKDFKKVFSISCTSKIPVTQFKETQYVKEMKVSSDLLSSFYKKATTINAAVILPAEYYSQPNRLFPVEYNVSSYSGDYQSYSGNDIKSSPLETIPCITVYLDGKCPTGHSTYANSINNGPWGDALVTEMIPSIEKKYRCDGARFLTGHSSGGWSALWLQVNYPKTFAGCWSSAPDPVDFRNFQLVNIYEDKNMYYDKDSTLRIDGSIAGKYPVTYLRDDYMRENVLYRGEQYGSWNAVFGKRQKNGMPESICDVNTGAIDTSVAAHWKAYDISLLLRNHWKELSADIDNKVRISVGTSDNFFLDKSVKVLEEEMKKLHSKFEFAYYPGDHFTVNSDEYDKDGYHFIATKYNEWLAQHPSSKN